MLLNKLIWYDDYTTEIEILDEQHKEIFSGFNKFYAELNLGHFNKDVIDEFIEILDSYVTTHFNTEEKFMREENYPHYEEHKKRHDFFKAIYSEIKDNSFFRNSAGHLFALHLATISGEWWETHIVTDDKELSNFLKKLNNRY
ncbi:MAG: bacteriohemerythrin [Candidatus Gastranaerophilaceae bacterium]|jgi:hemerythrin